MKNIVFLVLLSSSFLFSQNNKIYVEYKATVIANESAIDNLPGNLEVKKGLINEITKNRYYLLVIDTDNNISSFVEKESINNDLPKENNLNIRFGDNQNLYFYKDISKLLSFEEVNLDEKYLVKDTLIQFPWKIERETKKLGDLAVRKATFYNELDNTNITAWYSPKIPFTHGPQKYWGLPGLILQLKIEYLNKDSLFKTFTFSLLNMKLEEGIPIENINQERVISREEYNQKMDYAMYMTEDRGVDTSE